MCRSTKEFNIEDSVICTISSKRRVAATLYPRNMVCFRSISVNTLHKGDDDDDDDDKAKAIHGQVLRVLGD
jgi:hypothetical protein